MGYITRSSRPKVRKGRVLLILLAALAGLIYGLAETGANVYFWESEEKMAFTYLDGSLADGVAPTSRGAIYVVTATSAYIKYATFFNTGSSTVTIKVYVMRKDSTHRQIANAVLAQNEALQLMTAGEELLLSRGDELQAECTASTCDYVVFGGTR